MKKFILILCLLVSFAAQAGLKLINYHFGHQDGMSDINISRDGRISLREGAYHSLKYKTVPPIKGETLKVLLNLIEELEMEIGNIAHGQIAVYKQTGFGYLNAYNSLEMELPIRIVKLTEWGKPVQILYHPDSAARKIEDIVLKYVKYDIRR